MRTSVCNPRLVACLSLALLLLASAVSAHDGRAVNPGHRADAPPPTVSRLDLVSESFEGAFPPAGWHTMSFGNSYNWGQTNYTARTGSYCAFVQYGPSGTSQDEWLVTPALDLTGLTDIRLEFFEEEGYWADWGDHHYVMVSTTSQTDHTSFSIVADMTPATHSIGTFADDPVVIDLSAYAGEPTVYVALRYTGSYADHWFVDDVRIFEPWLHDLRAIALAPNDDQLTPGTASMPQVTVRNIGRSVEDFDVEVTIWEGGVQIYNETVPVAALAPEVETVVDMPTFMPIAGEYYDMQADVHLASDMDMTNNQLVAFNDAYTLPHVPLGMLLTQSDCPSCPQANQALDAYIPGQGNDVALIRVHVWWPGTDGIYDANTIQNQFLANGSGADYAPHLRIDQVVDAGSNGAGYAALFNTRKTHHSPLNIVHSWDPDTETLIVEVEVVENIPPNWPLVLRAAITEDDVYEVGTNGERYHNQAFRYMYPSTSGLSVPNTPGTYRYTINCPVSQQSWVYNNLRATVYVQNDLTWKVQNAATGFLTELAGVPVATEPTLPALLETRGNHPNPFNPETMIEFELARDHDVRLEIFDVDGQLVRTLVDGRRAAGLNRVRWDGADENGRAVASGTYFYRVTAGMEVRTDKMTMVK